MDQASSRSKQKQSPRRSTQEISSFHNHEFFDAIYSAHHSIAHQKVSATHSCCRKNFWNISQKQCSLFIQTCPACATEKPMKKQSKGSLTPIRAVP
jgi:hypothetical protein